MQRGRPGRTIPQGLSPLYFLLAYPVCKFFLSTVPTPGKTCESCWQCAAKTGALTELKDPRSEPFRSNDG